MRWNLLSSPILRGGDFAVTESGMRDTVRHVVRPIWNTWYFLTLYANAAGTTGTHRTDQTDVLDRYLLGELRTLVRSMTSTMDDYDLFGACQNVVEFVETLSNWYIRRSRDRFWAGDQDAIDTLHTALVTLCQVAAPLLPMVTEHIYAGLTGERSVHLTDWPDPEQFPHDDDLTTGMGQVRDVCSTLLSLRKAEGLRVRLPLAKATVATPTTELMRPHLGILRDELNVKEIELTDDVQSVGRVELNLNPARLGPRLGGQTQKVIKAHKAGDWSIDGDRVVVGGVELQPDEYAFRLVSASDGVAATLQGNNGIVVLDTAVTDALEVEGLARDLIRAVQQARRSAGLDVSDRISLAVEAPVAVVDAFEAHRELVMGETLATSATAVEGTGPEPVITVARV
jgi:isoleucyl-tRNA synthetase